MKNFIIFIVVIIFFGLSALIFPINTEIYFTENADVTTYSPTGVMMEYYYHTILRVSEHPLFNNNGSINQSVLTSLMEILNNPMLDPMLRGPKLSWPTGMAYTYAPFYSVTAYDFSRFVVPIPHMTNSGAVVIRLFDTMTNMQGLHNGHVKEFTSQWWQLVYRSYENGNDVLTLWMMQPYRLTYFSGDRYDAPTGRFDERFFERRQGHENVGNWSRIQPNLNNTIPSDYDIYGNQLPSNDFFLENNFSRSIARANLLRDFEIFLQNVPVYHYIVAPRDLPGNWQSSRFQTGSNMNYVYYASGEFYTTNSEANFFGSANPNRGLGATGLIWGTHRHFALINGKDGLSVGPQSNHWPNTELQPTYTDLLWLPSDFEIRTMGFKKDNARFQTFMTDQQNYYTDLRWNWSLSEEDDWRYDVSYGRSGLWRLNGFDRGFVGDQLSEDSWEANLNWLRSGDGISIGGANTVYSTGNRYTNGVQHRAGLRPGLHISITKLNQ